MPNQTSGTIAFFIDDGAGQGGIYSGANVQGGNWHHSLMVVDDANIYGYLDGVRVVSDTHDNSLPTNSSTWKIGSTDGVGEFYQGTIDDVRIYNRALSADEVKRLYNMGHIN